jgi:hypothetical protein
VVSDPAYWLKVKNPDSLAMASQGCIPNKWKSPMNIPTQHPFPNVNAQNGFRVFPAALEDDELVWFHGTSEANYN